MGGKTCESGRAAAGDEIRYWSCDVTGILKHLFVYFEVPERKI